MTTNKNKCPKTFTGKHYFEDYGDIVGCGNPNCGVCKNVEFTKVRLGDIKCRFCGIIDDRKEKKKK